VVIRPGVTRELKWAAGNFETLRGKVLSSWRRTDDGLRLEVMVPFGSTARDLRAETRAARRQRQRRRQAALAGQEVRRLRSKASRR
jgi:hypothetical protein